jgi:hypothetical protein
MQTCFVKTSIALLFAKDFFFPDVDYTSADAVSEDLKPSAHIFTLLDSLQGIVTELDSGLARGKILSRITEGIFDLMTEGIHILTISFHRSMLEQ